MKFNDIITKTAATVVTAAISLSCTVTALALDAPAVVDGYTRYEAEEATLVNGTNSSSFHPEKQSGQSGAGVSFTDNNGNPQTGGNVVGGFSTKSANDLNYDFSNTTSVRFEVEREETGVVKIVLGFRSSQEVNMEQRCANIPIKCNDGSIKEAEVGVDTDAAQPKKQAEVEVDMKAGKNYVYVGGPVAGGGWINIDYIDVSNSTKVGESVEPEEVEATPLPLNPVVKSIYTADPSAHVWSTDPNTLYIYPSHDRYPNIGCNRMDAYHIYSTQNMVDYKDCGEIFSAYDLEWGREAFENGKFDDGTFMWAPDAAYSEKTHKYYFYYPRPVDEYRNEWRVGVAVSDYPDHGFVDTGVPIAGIGGKSMIDPCVFTDDDGRSYIYLGGGGNSMNGCAVAELNDDMVTLKEQPRVMTVEGAPNDDSAFDENGKYIAPAADNDGYEHKDGYIKDGGIPSFHEGPYIFKKDGIYYFMYADGYNPNNVGQNRQRYVYSTEGPKGPWIVPDTDNTKSDRDGAYGVILDSLVDYKQDTSHGSIVGFKDKWYLFYHIRRISESSALRSVCVDEVTFADDGSINMVTPTEGKDIEPVGDRVQETAADEIYEAENAEFTNESSDIQPETETFQYNGASVTAVTNLMIPGAKVTFNNVDGGENGGRVNLKMKYSITERGYVKLNVNGRDYSFINLMGTGGKGFFSGETNITVTMKPGAANTITLSEFNKKTSLDKIEVRYLDK